MNLREGVYTEDKAFGHVDIYKKVENGKEEVAMLRIKVTPPPKPKAEKSKIYWYWQILHVVFKQALAFIGIHRILLYD